METCTGTITTFSAADLVGRIRLEDGTELRFGASALRDLVPSVGTKVTVVATAPHPLGGLRATDVRLADLDREAYEARAAAMLAEQAEATRGQAMEAADRVAEMNRNLNAPPLSEAENAALARIRERRAEDERLAREREALHADLTRTAATARRTENARAAWATIFAAAGLSPDEIVGATRHLAPGARLVREVLEGETPAVGATKIGGLPDVPPSFAWPRRGALPLAFVAQVRLGEVPATVRARVALPDDGLLLFFFDSIDQPWGFDPKHAGGAKVVFVDARALARGLARAAAPVDLDPVALFPERRARLREELCAPAYGSPSFEAMALGEDAADAYQCALDAYVASTADAPNHMFGGHATAIQNPMEVECALVTAGVYMGRAIDETLTEVRAARMTAPHWRLLLQLDSDDTLDMMWGDVGCLYFWMREDALHAQAFDNAWCILQCG